MTSCMSALKDPALTSFLTLREAGRLTCAGVPRAVLALLAARPAAATDMTPQRGLRECPICFEEKLLGYTSCCLKQQLCVDCATGVHGLQKACQKGRCPFCRAKQFHLTDLPMRLALHWAAADGASAETVNALLAASPDAASARDLRGMLPLHYAAATEAPVEVVAALLEAHPEGLAEMDAACQRAIASSRRSLELLDGHPRLWARAAAAALIAARPQAPAAPRAREQSVRRFGATPGKASKRTASRPNRRTL